MNERQKEVLRGQEKAEKDALKALEAQYKESLKGIEQTILELQSRPETPSVIYRREYQERLKQQVEAALDALHGNAYQTVDQFLNDTYQHGFIGTMYDLHGQGVPVIAPIDHSAVYKAVTLDSKLSTKLYDALGVDLNKLKKDIRSEVSRGIASGMTYEQITNNLWRDAKIPLHRVQTIVRTEGHRIQETSTEDARQVAKSKGADVVKQWDATLDGATRKTHRELDGQIRETDEPFEVNGKKAMYPGDFGDPAEDCNCRCCALTRARAALDADELAELKERAAFFELDKADDFKSFEEKYLKAAEKAPDASGPPILIGGVNCQVTKGKYSFGNGTGTGVKKTVNAVTYTTPDGTDFVFPNKLNASRQKMTPDQAIANWQKVPDSIRKQAQKTIEFVDYYNPQDTYWRKTYKNFTHSYATGGQKLTFYRYDYPHDDAYVVRTYCHEAGHLIDINLGVNGRLSAGKDWTDAMNSDIISSGKKSPTAYGENSPTEDFAESVAEFVSDRNAFKKLYPARFAILDKII